MLESHVLPRALAGVDLGPQVVEIGPGGGFTTEALLRSGAHVTVVELDETLAVQLGDRLAGSALDVRIGDARATGLPDATFSGAASFNMLHHVPTAADQDAVFAELRRIVRPGGRLVMADGLHSEGSLAFHAGDVYNPVEHASLAERLEAAGFNEVLVETDELLWYCRARRAC